VTEIDRLTSEMTERVKAELESWYGASVSISEAPSWEMRPWSIFVRFPLSPGPDRPRAILAKIRRHPDLSVREAICDDGLRDQAKNEFETLGRLQLLLASSRTHCAVRPLAYLEPWSAVVMEEIEAEQLRRRVLRGRVSRPLTRQSELETTFERAGSLLRLFHERVSSPETGPVIGGDVRATLTESLASVERRFPAADVRKIRHAVVRLEKQCNGMSLPYSRLHRDFNCSNVLLTSDTRVFLLDPRMTWGVTYRDVARLMVDLETLSFQGITHGHWVGERAVDGSRRAIVRGYFGDEQYVPVVLEFFRLLAVLEKWLADDELASHAPLRQGRRSARVRVTSWRRRFLLKLADRHCERLGEMMASA
jgi:Phosphotransferase enzyme family